jgi:hypothetical protein
MVLGTRSQQKLPALVRYGSFATEMMGAIQRHMSALPPKADIANLCRADRTLEHGRNPSFVIYLSFHAT